MAAMILFPAIDLKDGQCVRLLRGDMAAATVYNVDPAAQALSDDSKTDNTFPDDTNRGGTGQLTTSPAMSRPSAEMRAESDFRDVASG